MKKYKQFIIKTEPFLPDLLSGLLWEFDISGIDEKENSLIVFADEHSSLTKDKIESVLQKLIGQKLIKSFSVVEQLLEEKNWNEEWEKSREVIRATDRIVIRPTFKSYSPEEGEIVITIDPKMSFGTGEHESTKLALRLMEKHIRSGDKILDVGSGTGILSIAAVKMGAASAVAVDNDPWCYQNCVENCALNDVSEKIKVVEGEIVNITEKDFDLVLANIQKNILLNIAGDVYKKLKPKGYAILSGILNKDESDVVELYQSFGSKLVEKETLGEWLAVALIKI